MAEENSGTNSETKFKTYISPKDFIPEFTLKAIILGAVFGIIFGAATVYLGLKVGLTVSASIPIAVLAISIFSKIGKSTILENNIVKEDVLSSFVPEQVFSLEVGYKTKFINKIFFDAVFYSSTYRNFIGLVEVIKPRTSPTVDMFTSANQVNNSTQREQLYIYTNSKEAVSIQGISTGVKYIAPVGAIISGNFTWSNISTAVDDPIIPGFNTPKYKFNISIANRRLDKLENNPGFKNLGFNVTWRWQSEVYWQSPFGNGWIDPVSTWDIQLSYRFHKPESILKFGITNFFNVSHTTSFGGAQIGSFYYLSYTVENILRNAKKRKKKK